MKNKKIVVLLKYYQGELNPFDGAALECALETGANEIIALTMSPISVKTSFQSLTRLGVKCVMLSDSDFAGSDTQATSLVLVEAVKRLNPDYIFCGRQSVDGDTGQVPPMLAQRLGFSIKTRAVAFDGEQITLRNGERFIPREKTVITFEKIRALRFPSIFSKLGEIELWDNSVLKLPREQCGLAGSPTRVIKSYESQTGKRICQFVQAEQLSALITQSLKKPRIEQHCEAAQKLDEVYFVGDIQAIAERVAKRCVKLETANKTVEKLALETQGKIVLWEDSEPLKILASQTAVLTGAGLCADCIAFRTENSKFVMTRPALGGNITADIVCNAQTAFATVRTARSENGEIVFSVGKGAIGQIDKIKELAKKFNAEVCCSRTVADSGKLPYEQQVGLTGKTVSPKVYVAFGISGAVQHTCAIIGAGTVIAVNIDKNARIFDYADFGIIKNYNKRARHLSAKAKGKNYVSRIKRNFKNGRRRELLYSRI